MRHRNWLSELLRDMKQHRDNVSDRIEVLQEFLDMPDRIAQLETDLALYRQVEERRLRSMDYIYTEIPPPDIPNPRRGKWKVDPLTGEMTQID